MPTLEPPANVTKSLFDEWRDARRGKRPAESQNNHYWKWIVESKTSAYLANEHFGGPSSYNGNPVWEWSRYGQSQTVLPDGRQIFIAGEHEDHYDPDFFIYNDVVIRHPSGEIEFLGYPVEAFPPTDFHSATLFGDQIILIGNLGYPEDRKPGTTPILIVDTKSWTVSKQVSAGDLPGWIHGHQARLEGESIFISGGSVLPPESDKPLIESIDDWRLHLKDWRWERLTDRKWPLFEIMLADGQHNELWEMRQAQWELDNGKIDLSDAYKQIGVEIDSEVLKMIEDQTDYPSAKDPQALDALYSPDSISYKAIPQGEDEYNTHRIEIDGVTVRYVEESYHILVTIEGELPKTTATALIDDLVTKLGKVTEKEFQAKQIRP